MILWKSPYIFKKNNRIELFETKANCDRKIKSLIGTSIIKFIIFISRDIDEDIDAFYFLIISC